MRAKVWKILILVLFVGGLLGTAWWMFRKFTLQSPYYQETEVEGSDTARME